MDLSEESEPGDDQKETFKLEDAKKKLSVTKG